MIVLADEDIDRRIIEAIRGIGIEVQAVYFTNRGISDLEIIAWAKKPPPKVILTERLRFWQACF